MRNNELFNELRAPFMGEFKTVKQAFDYATSLLRASGADDVGIMTSLGVLMNTIANQLEIENAE